MQFEVCHVKKAKNANNRHSSIAIAMGELVISRAACRAISARRRTTAHITVVSSVLCTGYVVNKTVSYVLMNRILVTIL
jgi:hypothetical protein